MDQAVCLLSPVMQQTLIRGDGEKHALATEEDRKAKEKVCELLTTAEGERRSANL